MIARYTLPPLDRIWSDEHRFALWLEIEVCVVEALAERGTIPAEAARAIRERSGFDAARIGAIEARVKHDVLAFLGAVEERLGPLARYVHQGLTSSDVLDTALACQMREAGEEVLRALEGLRDALARRARQERYTPIVGRTHGVHAEPTSFGLKLALHYDALARAIEGLRRTLDEAACGKISGAVGTYAHIDPAVEEAVCRRLGIRPAPISSQIVPRDRHAAYCTSLALCAGVLEAIATEIRHLQRTEVREVEEPFTEGQKGSSAMPHKRNPVSCERVAGLARVVRANCLAALEDVPLWHERDISHSSVERVILPDSTTLLHYMARVLTEVIEGMVVNRGAMARNLGLTGGLIFSQGVLLELVRRGMGREEAYRRVQGAAARAWRGEGDFRKLLLEDPAITAVLPESELDRCFRLEGYLRHVDTIFARLGLREGP